MTITIGSARIDERGKASGGKAGDQKQKASPDYKGEVSMQNFYVSSKGWYILRAKNPQVASNIALAMTIACNNPNIGYNQAKRLDIIKAGAGTHATQPTSCDCSSLVRQCVREAGVEVGNFTTANEASVLTATGHFDKLTYKKGMALFLGDILVTCVKGHTVVVTSGYTRLSANIAIPTVKLGTRGAMRSFCNITLISAVQRLPRTASSASCQRQLWSGGNTQMDSRLMGYMARRARRR